MRIAYILNSLGVGGAERLTIDLSRRMAERGHAVVLVVLKTPERGDLTCKTPAFHLDISRNPFHVLTSIVRALRFIGKFRPDVLHSHSFHSNVFARLLGCLARVPVISTVHNVYEGGWMRMLAYRMTDRLCLETIAVSNAVAEQFLQRSSTAREKCRVIRNAIEIEAFEPDGEVRSRTRAEVGLKPDFVWLTVARSAPGKDHPTLLRAFEQVKGMYPETQLWVAGVGFPALEPMRMLAMRLGDSVRWLGIRDDVGKLLDAADGYVMSSAWEGLPLAITEAMAMEKPVVATDVGGVAEVVGFAGSLTPPRNPEKLAQAMMKVMGLSGEERSTLGAAARRRVTEEFNMETRGQAWERLYAEAVARDDPQRDWA